MILYFILICKLFILTKTEPLIGHNIESANPHEFPFIASLGSKIPNSAVKRHHFCTGSLITNRHVLTAAHCLENMNVNQVNVMIGIVNLRESSVRYKVDSWIKYDDWAVANRKTIYYPSNDIAIVKLTTVVDREGITPVTLTDLNDERLYRTKAVIAGWGVTNENTLSNELLKGKVTILTPEQCLRQFKMITGTSTLYEDNCICTANDPYVLTSCGDSGGPLLDRNNVLVGINQCTGPNIQWGNFTQEFISKYKVSRHTSINYYREFIESVAGISSRTVG